MFGTRRYLLISTLALLILAVVVLVYRYQFQEEEYRNLALMGEEALNKDKEVKVGAASSSVFGAVAESSGQIPAAGVEVGVVKNSPDRP